MGYTVPGWEMQFEAYIELHLRFKYEKKNICLQIYALYNQQF